MLALHFYPLTLVGISVQHLHVGPSFSCFRARWPHLGLPFWGAFDPKPWYRTAHLLFSNLLPLVWVVLLHPMPLSLILGSLLGTFLTFLSLMLSPLDALIWNVMLVANVNFKALKHTMISMVVSALFRLKTGHILVILAPFDSFGSEFSLFWVLKSLVETHFDYGGVLQLIWFNFCTILASLGVNVQELSVFELSWAWNFLLPLWG